MTKEREEIYTATAGFGHPHRRKATFQLVNTLVPYLVLWAAMTYLRVAGYSYLWILLLSIPAAGFHIRTFIIFHDCGHGSFLQSRSANRFWGFVTGVLTYTPYEKWRRDHARHHATVGDLDRRGEGDVWTMTVEEYRRAPLGRRLVYRFFRHPFVMFLLAPVPLFVVSQRFVKKGRPRKSNMSVYFTDLALLLVVGGYGLAFGFLNYLSIVIPVVVFSGSVGIWLFYVQHQFEGVYWERHDAWNPLDAALRGSSNYRLPAVLRWFTGNIGLHHIHHIQPRIPNYRLRECQASVSALDSVPALSISKSLRSLRIRLFDEASRRSVSFRFFRRTLAMGKS